MRSPLPGRVQVWPSGGGWLLSFVAVMASSFLHLVVLVILSLTEDLVDVPGNVLSSLTSGVDLIPIRVRCPWLHRNFRLCAAVLRNV